MNFDVLSIPKITFPLLVEASAGTGKTFTIEHLVVRSVLEHSLDIKRACIITFTKACAKELSLRIRKALENALKTLEDPSLSESCFQYLKVYFDSEMHTFEAIKKLRSSLYELSSSTISTIHGFCLKMLKEYYGLENTAASLEFASKKDLFLLFRDFLSFVLTDAQISAQELYVLLEAYKYDYKELFEKIIKNLWKQDAFLSKDSQYLLSEFYEKIKSYKNVGYTHDLVKEKLYALATNYNGLFDRSGVLKHSYEKAFSCFCDLFNHANAENLFIRNSFVPSVIFSEEQRKKKSKEIDHDFRDVLLDLEKSFIQLIEPQKIFDRLVQKMRPFILERLESTNRITQDELLDRCSRLSEKAQFRSFLQNRFDFVIVDEFQDTDPLQWNILAKSFLDKNWTGSLYLVGDPKQAIYSFRGADVYSYIEAKKILGPESVQCLNTNYRATSGLVDGLNALFRTDHSSPFFLPRINESLAIPKILSSNQTSSHGLFDKKGSIHFFVADCANDTMILKEEMSFFPFIGHELSMLYKMGVELKDVAILVSDRFQQDRLGAFLKKKSIPHTIWKKGHLCQTEAYSFCHRMCDILFRPKDKKTLIRTLACAPFLFSEEKLREFQGECKAALHLWGLYAEQFQKMRKTYDRYGFSQSFQSLLSNPIFRENIDHYKTIDPDFFWDLEQILSRLTENEESIGKSQGNIKTFLQSMLEIKEDEDVATSRPQSSGVNILTTHRSKGLEFDFVFALGAVTKTRKEDDFLEKDAEKIRQFYVAVTRAKKRVYIPLDLKKDKIPEPGTASSVDLFFAYLAMGEYSCDKVLYDYMSNEHIQMALEKYLEHHQITKSEHSTTQDIHVSIPSIENKRAFSDVPLMLSYNEKFASFTYFNRIEKSEVLDLFQNDQKRDFAALDFPSGGVVGTYIHELLQNFLQNKEKICTSHALKPWILNTLKGSCLQGYEEIVFKLFWKLLDTPFSTQEDTFFLRSENKLLCEFEFCYKEETTFVRGAIDLVVETKHGFYIVDWKTNVLGDEVSAYDKEGLLKEIERNNYILQAKIYSRSVDMLIKSFRGVFFVFLRGLLFSDDLDDRGIIYFPKEAL